jgi:hypothetical protein
MFSQKEEKLRLPNEILAEIVSFIPYKEKFELDGEKCYNLLDCPKGGLLLSSKAISIPYANFLRATLEKRHIELNKFAKDMRKLLSGQLKFREAFDETRHRYYLLGQLGWYWDMPKKDEETLCCICFMWGNDQSRFVLCNKGGVHTLHKGCLKFFPHCLICSPLWDQM